tara:strand:- start:548 stop:793 length:246 start_codon:yes stop_codon:yes gene_type:complete
MKIDIDKIDKDFESFLKEAEEIQKEVDLLHHQMNSTIRCMDKVNTKINGLKTHPMFDNLPREMKEQLFNIQGANDAIKSEL